MTLNMTAVSLKNGLSTVTIQSLGPSALSQERVSGETNRAADTGAQSLSHHMKESVTFSLAVGMMISVSIANSLELTYFSMPKTLVSSLRESHKLIKKEFLPTVKFATTSSLTTCLPLSFQSWILSSSIALSRWLSQPATSRRR